MVSTGVVRAVRKHLAQTVYRLALPSAHLVWMHPVPGRDFLNGFVATERLKRNLGLEIRREPASLSHLRIPPLSGGIHLSSLSDFLGPPQNNRTYAGKIGPPLNFRDSKLRIPHPLPAPAGALIRGGRARVRRVLGEEFDG